MRNSYILTTKLAEELGVSLTSINHYINILNISRLIVKSKEHKGYDYLLSRDDVKLIKSYRRELKKNQYERRIEAIRLRKQEGDNYINVEKIQESYKKTLAFSLFNKNWFTSQHI